MAIEEVAFDRLAQPGGPAGAVRFPTGRKHERAADREVRSCTAGGLLWRPLQRHDVALRGALHTLRLAVHSLEMLHASSPSTHLFGRHRLVELREKRRIPLGKLTVDLQAHVGPAADPVA